MWDISHPFLESCWRLGRNCALKWWGRAKECGGGWAHRGQSWGPRNSRHSHRHRDWRNRHCRCYHWGCGGWWCCWSRCCCTGRWCWSGRRGWIHQPRWTEGLGQDIYCCKSQATSIITPKCRAAKWETRNAWCNFVAWMTPRLHWWRGCFDLGVMRMCS